MTNYIACRDKPFTKAERRKLEAWIKEELAREVAESDAPQGHDLSGKEIGG